MRPQLSWAFASGHPWNQHGTPFIVNNYAQFAGSCAKNSPQLSNIDNNCAGSFSERPKPPDKAIMADGLRKGLTSYGDAGFSLFLRKAFIKAMGYSDDALNRPIVGITNTYS